MYGPQTLNSQKKKKKTSEEKIFSNNTNNNKTNKNNNNKTNKNNMAFLGRWARNVAVGAGGLYAFNKLYISDLSTSFYGRTREWEHKLDEDLGFKLGDVGSLAMEFMIKSAMPNNYFRPNLAAEELVEKFPKLHIGYSLLSVYYKDQNDPQKMIEYLKKSEEILGEFPEENKNLNVPIPTREDLYQIPWDVERQEVVPGKLWFISSPFKTNLGKYIDLMGYIFKKQDGTIVLVNPVRFDEKSLNFINNLGEVSAVVSPCIGHDECWRELMGVFPTADFYHVQKQSNIPSNIKSHILEIGQNPFAEDLDMVNLQGHLFKEACFIHKESKTLMGPVDMTIPQGVGFKGAFGFALYSLAMGLNRGPKETEPFALQCYHHVFVTNRRKLRHSVKDLLSRDIETVLPGHMFVVRNNGSEHLKQAFGPYLDDNVAPTYVDRVYFFCKFFGKMRLSREFWANFTFKKD